MATPRKTHPMILVAAASVTALSLTGVAALSGWLPQHGSAANSPMAPLAAVLPAEAPRAASAHKTDGPTTLAIPSGSRITVDASQVPAANPFLVMLLIPLTSKGLYPLMDKIGIGSHPLRRMTVGMFMTAGSFVAVALIQHAIDAGANVHVLWQVIPYLILTTGEVMVSITGLEFGYSQAPKRMKSVIMSLYLLSISAGNLVTAAVNFAISRLNLRLEGANYYLFFTALAMLASVVFVFFARRYTEKSYLQDETPAA